MGFEPSAIIVIFFCINCCEGNFTLFLNLLPELPPLHLIINCCLRINKACSGVTDRSFFKPIMILIDNFRPRRSHFTDLSVSIWHLWCLPGFMFLWFIHFIPQESNQNIFTFFSLKHFDLRGYFWFSIFNLGFWNFHGKCFICGQDMFEVLKGVFLKALQIFLWISKLCAFLNSPIHADYHNGINSIPR